MTAPVEEVFEIDFNSYAAGDIGTQRIDPPVPCAVKFYERLVIGGNVAVSVSTMSGSNSLTTPITSANQIDLKIGSIVYDAYDTGVAAWCEMFDNTGSGPSGFATVSTKFNGVAVGAPGTSGSDATHSWDGTGGSSVSCNCGATPVAVAVQLDMSACPPRPFTQNGRIAALDLPYPVDLKVVVTQYAGSPGVVVDVPEGDFTSSYTQQRYNAGLALNQPYISGGIGGLVSYDDSNPVSGIIQSASLSTAGEDTDCTRLQFRGFKWDAMTISNASGVYTDQTPRAANWSAGTHTTVANSGSDAITATVSGLGTGSISTTLPAADSRLKHSDWSGVSFCGYRFLRLQLTADADDQPASVVIGSKQWDVVVNSTGIIDIDLCCPTNRAVTTDATDTQWSWNGPAPYSINDGEFWGVSNVSTLSITNLAESHQYLLAGLQLVLHTRSGMSFLPTYKGWIQAFPSVTVGSVTSTTYYRRARLGDTDGRQSREDTDAVWIHTDDGDGGVTDTYSEVSIAAVVSGLHTGGMPPRDGWDATDLHPDPNIATPGTCTGTGSDPLRDCFLNSTLSSCWLYGSGALYDGSRWTPGMDIRTTDSATIPAQVMFDIMADWYPGIGDAWGWQGGAYDTPLALRCAAILRGQAHGLGFDTNGAGVRGVVVDVKDSATGLIDVGSGTTDLIGEYTTGVPYGIGLVSYKVTAEAGSPEPSITEAFKTRHRSRFCFAGLPVFQPPCCGTVFCPDYFLYPFIPLKGDHTILPLDDWRQILDSEDEEDKENDKQPALAGAGSGS